MNDSERPSRIASIEMPDVFELTIASSRMNGSIVLNNCCLTSSRSTTTSTIQSASFRRSKSSSKFPTSMKSINFFDASGAGFCFKSFSRLSRAMRERTRGSLSVKPCFSSCAVSSFGTISSINVRMPAFARCAAMPAPITPEPMMTANWMCFVNWIVVG